MALRETLERMSDRVFSRSEGGRRLISGKEGALRDIAPLGGTREEAMQRLQIGVSGIVIMLAVIGIAGVVGGQAELAEETAVPDAAPTVEPTEAPAQRDPLVDAGVVPDIPSEPEVSEPTPNAKPTGTSDPETGEVTVPDTPPARNQDTSGGS